jgi:hypothetical protein
MKKLFELPELISWQLLYILATEQQQRLMFLLAWSKSKPYQLIIETQSLSYSVSGNGFDRGIMGPKQHVPCDKHFLAATVTT